MRRNLEQWRALTGRERWLLVNLTLLLPAIGGALRLLGVRRTYRLLGGTDRLTLPGGTAVSEDSLATAAQLGRLVNIAARRGPYNATCLRQSLALWWLLRRRDLPAVLRIGVGKQEQQVRAHAWVELAGQVVNDHPLIADEYSAFQGLDQRLPGTVRAR